MGRISSCITGARLVAAVTNSATAVTTCPRRILRGRDQEGEDGGAGSGLLERRVRIAFEPELEVLRAAGVRRDEGEGDRCRSAGLQLFRRFRGGLADAVASERIAGNPDAGLFERAVEEPIDERVATS